MRDAGPACTLVPRIHQLYIRISSQEGFYSVITIEIVAYFPECVDGKEKAL